MRRLTPSLLLAALVVAAAASRGASQEVAVTGSGGLKRWHKVTLTLAGPQASEGGTPNPFLDYRMTVTFTHAETGLAYAVPGYFAADGDAASSSAREGDRWRAHLSPDHTGSWRWAVGFRAGPGAAVADDPAAGSAVAPFDGLEGSFRVAETDASGRDHRVQGRLRYAGKPHLRFQGGKWFLKAGADSPENFLACSDFDGTPDHGGRRKRWEPHERDFRPGDPTWRGGRGRGIIGAVNYLAGKGMNALSFLTYSQNGDDGNVFPHADPADRTRMDCSKLDQWEIVFEHADRMGIYLHFKTQETENDQDMDGGALGPERRLYYRELIARFGHHLALNWNLGEENSNTTEERRRFARYFWDHDPYRHLVVVHTFPDPKEKDKVYLPLLGEGSKVSGASLQSSPGAVFSDTRAWREAAERAGRPWVVACDEQGPADVGVKPDADDPEHDGIRRDVLWGNLMAGGAGVEFYFGYKFAHSDLTCEDFRSRERLWDLARFALEFFRDQDVPFWEMRSEPGRVSGADAWCLAGGRHFAVYLRRGGTATLDLSGAAGAHEVRWYDPRRGGPLRSGSVPAVEGGGPRELGRAPEAEGQDWAVLVRPAAEGGRGAPGR